MIITYAKFINFAGIYAGTGRNELELDFSNTEYNITLFQGMNGSSKTTIMSLLNPIRESTDQRKDIILEKQDGYKEIHLKDKKDNYIIRHYYGESSSKNKSYISKNGKELNDNGGIKLFYEILKREMNLTKDYFTIGKMSSDLAGFIGMSTSDRKTYINKFVPNIDEYLEAYEKINNLFKSYNKDIKSLKEMLSNLNIDNLNIEKTNYETILKNNSINQKNLNKKILLNENKLNKLEENIKDLPENFENDYLIITNNYNDCIKKKDDYFKKYPKLSIYNLEKIKLQLISKNNELESANKTLELNKTILEKNLKDNNDLLKEINRIENLLIAEKEDFLSPTIIKNELNSLENDNVTFDSKISKLKNKLSNKIIIKLEEKELSNRINEKKLFFNNIETIKSNYTMNLIESVNFEEDRNYKISIKNNLDNIMKYENKKDLLTKEKISIELDKKKYSKILLDKPKDCLNSNCIFIKDALNFSNNILPKYDTVLDNIDEYENKIIELQKENEILNDKINFIKDVKQYVFDRSNDFIFLPLIININEDFNDILKSTSLYENKIDKILEYCNDYLSLKEQIKENKRIIELKKEVYKINLSKEKLINNYLLDLDNKKNKLEEIKNTNEKYNNLNLNINKDIIIKNNTIKLLLNVKDLLIKYEDTKNKYEEYSIIYNNNKNYLEEINDLNKNNSLYNKEMKELENEQEKINNLLDNIKNNLFLHKTYSDKLNLLETDIQDLSIIKDSLDPKKGIPLIFMKNYLNSISKITNDLLDTAYNGDFKIKFEITSKEFLIKVYKSNGTVLKDISDASQGEKSLTTISLSLAMINVLFKDCKYNILYLDECDGALDTNNRKNFINIINMQLNTCIDQCFIISHNNEFDSSPINLILLKDNNVDINNKDIMENKKIIFNLYDENKN